jgi:hypothetical protein
MAGVMPSLPPGAGPANALLRPTQTPQRFGPPMGAASAMPPMAPGAPGNALAGMVSPRPIPATPVVPPVPAVPLPGPINPGVQGLPAVERISDRAPVPKHHFPEEHHQHLHDKTMGKDFDDPDAQDFVRRVYDATHRGFSTVAAPKHILEATRDAYHAVKHGFMPPGMAGASVGPMAKARHIAEQAKTQRDLLAADRKGGDTK